MGIHSLVGDEGLNIVSNGDDHSVLLVHVHQKHCFGKTESIGCFSDTIGGMLGRLKDGGVMVLELTHSADMIAMVKVLKATISLNSSNEPDLSGNMAMFTLDTEPCMEVDSYEHQAIGAITMVTKMVIALHIPAFV